MLGVPFSDTEYETLKQKATMIDRFEREKHSPGEQVRLLREEYALEVVGLETGLPTPRLTAVAELLEDRGVSSNEVIEATGPRDLRDSMNSAARPSVAPSTAGTTTPAD